jgi:predicted permease
MMQYQSLLPIFVFFIIGILLRLFGLANREQSAFLFRVVLYVTLPALVFLAIADAELTRRTVFLPVAGFVVNLVCVAAAIFYVRTTKLADYRAGALVLGAGITNMLFVFPFVVAVLGQSALADAILFDLGNAVFVGTIAYSTTLHFGKVKSASVTFFLLKTMRAPIFVSVAAGIVTNLFHLSVPAVASNILSPLGATTIPLVLMAVGISFSTKGLIGALPVVTLLLRMPFGLIVGALVAWVLGFEGLTAAVIVISAAAPIGFSSVTLASIGGLDTEQATSALSLSVAIGMVSTTLLLISAVQWLRLGG